MGGYAKSLRKKGRRSVKKIRRLSGRLTGEVENDRDENSRFACLSKKGMQRKGVSIKESWEKNKSRATGSFETYHQTESISKEKTDNQKDHWNRSGGKGGVGRSKAVQLGKRVSWEKEPKSRDNLHGNWGTSYKFN